MTSNNSLANPPEVKKDLVNAIEDTKHKAGVEVANIKKAGQATHQGVFPGMECIAMNGVTLKRISDVNQLEPDMSKALALELDSLATHKPEGFAGWFSSMVK